MINDGMNKKNNGDNKRKPEEIDTKTSFKKKKIIRCSFCKKKCPLINYSCKCGGTFCQNHRLSHSHDCAYLQEKKMKMKNEIKKNNQIIIADKVIKI